MARDQAYYQAEKKIEEALKSDAAEPLSAALQVSVNSGIRQLAV
jgi:hypothetical protein